LPLRTRGPYRGAMTDPRTPHSDGHHPHGAAGHATKAATRGGHGAGHGHHHGNGRSDDHGHRHGQDRGHDHDHGHDRGHGHGHAHEHSRGLGVAFWLIAGFMLVEAAGGWYSNSLALMADAGHMFVDTFALALAWGAQRLALRPASSQRSFGHARTQVLAAFVNSLLLLGIVVAIVLEAGQRLLIPHPINAPLALGVALGGIAVNLCAAWLLHGHGHDLNMRAAYLHVLSDLAGSVAAVLAAAIVIATGWLPADAWLSLVVALLIARGAWRLLSHSAHVLQEGTPEGFDAAQLGARLVAAVPEVVDVHHVHAWSLAPHDTLLTLHARLAAGADSGATLIAIKRLLVEEYAISHSTIQLEPADCVDHERDCAPEVSRQDAASEARARW
jgi:cobalt-zinc-cadmium efflux system protein